MLSLSAAFNQQQKKQHFLFIRLLELEYKHACSCAQELKNFSDSKFLNWFLEYGF